MSNKRKVRKESAPARAASNVKEGISRAAIAAAVVSGVAGSVSGGMATAAFNFVHQAVENLASQQYRATPSGGQYVFGSPWAQYAEQSQQAAESLAMGVVNIAQQKAALNLSAVDKHRYAQWVLMGNIGPSQADDILVRDDNNKSADESLTSLVELMSANSFPAWTAADYKQDQTSGYLFGSPWAQYAEQSQQAAESLAMGVVNIAQQKAALNLSPADKNIYAQWVLMGNIGPSQADDILVRDDNNKSADESLTSLVELMSANSFPAWWVADYKQLQTNESADSVQDSDGLSGIMSSVYDWSQNPDSRKMSEILTSIQRLAEDPYFRINESASNASDRSQDPGLTTEDRDSAPEDPPGGWTQV